MDQELVKGWKCKVSGDGFSATLLIDPPPEGKSISVEDITAYLKSNGVIYGVVFSEIESMVRGGVYYKDVVVAKGTQPVDGVPGYYELLFESGQIKHPTIRSDGSVDYQSMNIIHSIRRGEVLAIYHPAIPGTHGKDVRGREKRCKPGKELQPLTGSGFSSTQERDLTVKYVAEVDGRVEYQNNKLYVRDVYEHKGDLDLVTGRIDFLGDVIIHGSVRAGTTVRASKSITIEGNVEAAVISAEGDIVLKKGMQGGKRAKLVSGGDIYAYFLEYTDVTAKGSVEANIILNCKVEAGKGITVKGKKGYIVGGSYIAAGSVTATSIGNQAMVRTVCSVGNSKEQDDRNHLLSSKYENTKKSIELAKKDIVDINDVRLNNDTKEVRQAKINQLKRRIQRDERMLKHIERELEEIRAKMSLSSRAKITAEGYVYPNTLIRIDDKEMSIDSVMQNTEFYRPSVTEPITTRSAGLL